MTDSLHHRRKGPSHSAEEEPTTEKTQEISMTKAHLVSAVLCIASLLQAAPVHAQSWQSRLTNELPLMGHRNWILVVDSAYPEQVGAGIETIETNAEQLDVVRTVLGAMQNSIHVRPVIFIDAELPFVSEQKAPGVSAYRTQAASLLHAYGAQSRLHQALIDDIAKDSTHYHVLILKTRMAIPYTSVFIHLDCKYWSAEDEGNLRQTMSSGQPQ
jgi:hypothetical protein